MENIVSLLIISLVIGSVMALIYKARQKKAKATLEAARLRFHILSQQGYCKEMTTLCEESLELFESLPNHLHLAEEYLDQAERDFADRAFAPFWDSIEKAVTELACFDQGVRGINHKASHYITLTDKYFGKRPNSLYSGTQFDTWVFQTWKYLDEAERDLTNGDFKSFWYDIKNAKIFGLLDEHVRLTKEKASLYEDSPPEFPVAPHSIAKLGVASATSKRMQSIVRKAQCDFQFATIYEQRKTNKILVEGFTSLATALNEMTWQITDSIEALGGSVNESIQAIHLRIGEIHRELSKEASERALREKKALEMLDNIQRSRRPSP